MKSVSGKYWEEIKTIKRLTEKIKIDHKLNDIQAKIVNSRNFTEEEIFSINNNINLSNPFLKNEDFLYGCKILKNQISKKNKILVVGDYDVDGCTSTALMVRFLKENNANVNYYIPNRFQDGYGASINLIIRLINIYNPKSIIFLDCGSTSNDVMKYLRIKKVSSIIIDHHNLKKPFPLSDTLINPKKKNKYEKFDYLCTAFLTFFFIDTYIKINQLKISIEKELIYVTLATVADVMPIRGYNRILALNVLKNFNINQNIIFTYLCKILKLKNRLNLDNLAYLIAPIFNAPGRLDDANQIVEMLITKSSKRKIQILKHIYQLNIKRKFFEKEILKDFNFENLHKQEGILFIYKPNIQEGIIGIIASRMKEYFNRPCIVFTNSDNFIKGSARSTLNFNIGEYIQKALDKKILISGGGHNLAAGITLSKSKMDIFKDYINYHYNEKCFFTENFYFSKILLRSINKDFYNNIKMLGPFGSQNSDPIFLIEQVKIVNSKIIKEKFIQCFVKKNNKMIKAMSFSHLNTKISYEILNSKNTMDILIKIKDNNWNNRTTIELEIVDIISYINKT